jgi:hypothetical protein
MRLKPQRPRLLQQFADFPAGARDNTITRHSKPLPGAPLTTVRKRDNHRIFRSPQTGRIIPNPNRSTGSP